MSFHSLPISQPYLLQKWLRKIRHPVKVNKYTKICGMHFEGNRRSGEDDMPKIFPWTYIRPPPRDRSNTVQQLVQVSPERAVEESSERADMTLQMPMDGGESPERAAEESLERAAEESPERAAKEPPERAESADATLQVSAATLTTDTLSQTTITITPDTVICSNINSTQSVHCAAQTPHSFMGGLCIDNISASDRLVQLYTGFTDFNTLKLCFDFLGPSICDLQYHNQPKKGTGKGAPRILSPINEFLLVLCRLRLHLLEEDLAFRFKISQSSVSRIFITWINLLYCKFKEVDIWPSREQVDYYMPIKFQEQYPMTRCILDATEIFIEQPSSPTAQQLTFSCYKNHNTLKALIGITPSGAISFVSTLFGGCISDRELTIKSGVLEKLETGDSIMADKGFLIADLLEPLGVTLNIPPLKQCDQFSEAQMIETRRIASQRVHVERAIGRIKTFHILSHVPNTIAGIIDQVFFVCAVLTNFKKPLL